MSTVADSSVVSRTRRRPAARPAKGQGDKSVKVGVYLSLDSARKLGVTATYEGKDKSTIIEELIQENLRKYVVHTLRDRAGSGDQGDISTSAA